MKKLFFTLIAFMCMGVVHATDISTYTFTSRTWTATLNNSGEANWTCDSMAFLSHTKGMQVTTTYNTAGATSPVSFNNIKQIVVTYGSTNNGAGSVVVKIGTNKPDTLTCEKKATDQTLVYDYDEVKSGFVSFVTLCTTNSIYIKSIAITHNYSATAPDIQANKIELPTAIIGLEDSGYAKDTTLVVTTANLTEDIAVSFIGTHLSAYEETLPAAGGTLHLHVEAGEAVQLSDTIVLEANGVTTKVAVEGKIKQNIALSGTAVTITNGTEATDATIDGIAGKKVGLSNANGNVTITVPAYTEKLRFYVAAWTGTSGNITVSAPAGVTLSSEALTLLADAGITGNSPFTLNALIPTPFKQEITLSGVKHETTITISSGTARRFVIWDAKCDVGEAPEPASYTVHYLSKDASEIDYESVSLTLPDAPIVSGFTFLYWKTVEGDISEYGIRIQAVYKSDTATEAPAVVVNPANPSQKLIRDGNVYILHDNRTFTTSGTLVR